MNSFRFYNLSKMALGQYNGLTYSWDVKHVVDLLHSDLSDYGNITAGGDAFPNQGAGTHHGNILGTSFSFGDLSNSSVTSFDYGAIA